MPGSPFFFDNARADLPKSAIGPTDQAAFLALRAFLLKILPPGTEVIKAQVNRVPEPKSADFVLMTPLRRERIETNVDDYFDVLATGTILGNVLTVTAVTGGRLRIGARLNALGMPPDTIIIAFGTGSGGPGTYIVSTGQSFAPSSAIGDFVIGSSPIEGPILATWPPSSAIGYFVIGESPIEGPTDFTISAGVTGFMQPTKLVIQLDVHGPNSADNAQVITTLFRDAFAVEAMKPNVTPLYADEAKQIPFINDQSQYEYRWVIEAAMQINPVVAVSGVEFADEVTFATYPVQELYPA